MRNSFAIF